MRGGLLYLEGVRRRPLANRLEEANDSTARKAHIEALFRDTKMAATDDEHRRRQMARNSAEGFRLPDQGDEGAAGRHSLG